jgi:hypothetical protein
MMQPRRMYRTRETLFARSWSVPKNETLLGELVRRFASHETTFKTPWGGKIKCSFIFLMGGCFGVPPDPWKAPQLWKPPLDDYGE